MAEATARQIRQLHRENRQWPEKLTSVPREEWPFDAFGRLTRSTPKAVWRSRGFLLIVWDQAGTQRLSIQRTDYDLRSRHQRDGIGWDDLQRLKSEAGFGDRTAVELFPPDDRIVNVANLRHLFIVDEPEFMW